MQDSPDRHFEAARRHEDAANMHDRSAIFWSEQGDAERAALQRRLAEHERQGADLERQWGALVDQPQRNQTPG